MHQVTLTGDYLPKHAIMAYYSGANLTGFKVADYGQLETLLSQIQENTNEIDISVSGLNIALNTVTGDRLLQSGINYLQSISGRLQFQDSGVTNNVANTVNTSSLSGGVGIALPANTNRKYFFVQNLSTTNSIYVKLGGVAHSGNFNIALKKDDGVDNGNGGNYSDSFFKGAVGISGVDTVQKYLCWEAV